MMKVYCGHFIIKLRRKVDNMKDGFMKYSREENPCIPAEKRIKTYNEFHSFLSEEPRRQQAARCMNCGVPFCGAGIEIKNKTIGCPLHNYIPEWNALISKGLYFEAYQRLMLMTSFPEFTGRVCPALCEVGCLNQLITNPVTIQDNELFIIEEAFKNGWVQPHLPTHRTGYKIAVIGSGPAGLAVANELNLMGHEVTIFEKSDRFGGLLMYGIPNMKLDKSIIERRISIMKSSGIQFVANFDCLIEAHKRVLESFDVLCFATGTQAKRDLKIPGRDLENILFAVDYLTASTKSLLQKTINPYSAKDRNVIIVGGGDTGNDCVATAIREGAKSVTQLEIMPKSPEHRTNEWPEWPNHLKTDYGVEEGNVVFGHDIRQFQKTCQEFKGTTKVESVVISEVQRKHIQGKIVFQNVGPLTELPAELVILAMGFEGTQKQLLSSYGIPATNHQNMQAVQHQIVGTKYFTCGDARTGQSLVVKAIADGRNCAKAIHSYLLKK